MHDASRRPATLEASRGRHMESGGGQGSHVEPPVVDGQHETEGATGGDQVPPAACGHSLGQALQQQQEQQQQQSPQQHGVQPQEWAADAAERNRPGADQQLPLMQELTGQLQALQQVSIMVP
jgi:hypothetical protein